jgi:hypothetical protein
MTRKCFGMLGAALLSAALLLGGGTSSQAQEYWRTYRAPYYGAYRSYYVAPPAYPTYYAPIYRSYPAQPYYYGYGPTYSSYYAPSYYGGYYVSPYYSRSVQVGRPRIVW